MVKDNYLYYKDYFKTKNIENKTIFISKTNNSYLIGPLIDSKFDIESFHKRIKSNSVYTTKIYKKMLKSKTLFLINNYKKILKSNEVIEVFKDGTLVNHKIIKIPGGQNEKKQVIIK